MFLRLCHTTVTPKALLEDLWAPYLYFLISQSLSLQHCVWKISVEEAILRSSFLLFNNKSRKLIAFFCAIILKMTAWLYHLMECQRLNRSLLIDLRATVFKHPTFFQTFYQFFQTEKNPIHYLESKHFSSASYSQRNWDISCLSNFHFPKRGTGT